ncbi:MAG: c-type cytochrome, partial [Planctomycetes bacterium]|nr:c-type cytochrome [Planctomycetota bacterium]
LSGAEPDASQATPEKSKVQEGFHADLKYEYGGEALPAQQLKLPEGFQAELVYSVPKEEQGSWVSLTDDPKGRLIASDQYGGIYRIDPGRNGSKTRVEKLDVDLGHAQGLLYVYDSLYVMVNGDVKKKNRTNRDAGKDSRVNGYVGEGRGLYRLRDTNQDDQFDEVKLLKKFEGGGEHGPHAIVLGPEGKLYIIAGNNTKIPEPIADHSPHRGWAEDLLLPRQPDARGHATNRMAPGGWVARTDKDGQEWELICAGFRNPYDLAFNEDGELFTFDADMEWDVGTPWYRPTRVCHVVSGGEFGWRFGTGKWPVYFPDSLPSVVDIGLTSPTGVTFGTGAKFPQKYQRAFYILDWSYGTIYAVHLQSQGSSYGGSFEKFVTGKPLPVTDVVINKTDGAMYFTVGGRRAQSGLYRVTYPGYQAKKSKTNREEAAAEARRLRRQLESFHGRVDEGAVDFSWEYLNSKDRHLRYAARIAIEHQPLGSWKKRAFKEKRMTASINALLAVARVGQSADRSKLFNRLVKLPWPAMNEEQTLEALRVMSLAIVRLGKPGQQQADKLTAALNRLYPALSDTVNRELCRLLVYFESPAVVAKTMELLKKALTQEDQMYYVFILRNIKAGWTEADRKGYFGWLNTANETYKGGKSFGGFLDNIKKDALTTMTPAEQAKLADVIEGTEQVVVAVMDKPRQYVHNWQMQDFAGAWGLVDRGRSFAKGQEAFRVAQCLSCHRFKNEGGAAGHDLTGAGNRFSVAELLESIVHPSRVISDEYQATEITLKKGDFIIGRIEGEDDSKLVIRTHPLAAETMEVSKEDIVERKLSPISQMPVGLISILTREEVFDLLAYLRSGGNPDDPAFQKSN